jgi:ubiquinone/menaquinone biosynthesis C-methylase UbiE
MMSGMEGHLGQIYDSMAASYAEHSAEGPYNAYYDRPNMLDLCGDVNGLRVLDAGCGPGLYAEALVERGAEVIAIDASQPMVDIARARLGDRAEVHCLALGAPLPFASASFDLVVCALVIHYVDDRAAALAELARVLRPAGAVVLSTQHPIENWLYKGGSYFDVAIETDTWARTGADWEVRYWREPLTSLCDAVYRAGLLIERLVEPLPTEPMRDRYPDDYAKLCRQPAFLNLRLVKRASRAS